MRWILVWVLWCGAALADPSFWKHEWPETDFDKSSISNWVEIMSGGPGKDGIPAIDDPGWVEVGKKSGLEPREAVITLAPDGTRARAYPLRYLMWHEIVNDSIGGVPVAVTYCPLCNSAIVFDRRVGGRTLSFGVTGKLRNSDMVMYDRETQSWWQQALGQGIVGELNGTTLNTMPSWMESWEAFKAAHPDGLVMAEPAFPRSYGTNPYRRYDTSQRPFLYSGDPPPHGIPALERVVRVGDRAWPMSRLAKEQEISQAGVTLIWADTQSSALDSGNIGQGREVGAIRVKNEKGKDIAHDVLFAFAFHAFWPNGQWMLD